jgi:uncharacterized protein (TIGR02145 family)
MNKIRFTSLTASLVLAITFTISCGNKDPNSFKDNRDGKKYKTVTIGNRVWMAENLNYEGDGGTCYDGKEENCAKYGRLYPWDAEPCPAGWRLPIDADWAALAEAAGGGKKLKASAGWKDNGNGTDDYGFAALPGGYGPGNGGEAGEKGYWWSATLAGISESVSILSYRAMQFDEDYVGGGNEYGDGARYFSVRCVQESDDKEVKAALEADAKQAQEKTDNWNRRVEEMEAELEAEERARQIEEEAANAAFTDSRDEKTYKKVTIGSQTWMAENLNFAAKGSKCYDNKPENCEKYGRLYDWNSALKACPSGWHLSSAEEWTVLENFAGGIGVAGEKLKAKSGWNEYEGKPGNGTDEFGFSALPSGDGSECVEGCEDFYFERIGYGGSWWSAAENGSYSTYRRHINYSYSHVTVYDGEKSNLFSVRCIQD